MTDSITGVANAFQARSPLVLLGGAAPLKTKGMGALQEIPQVELFQTITKASFTIKDTADIPGRLAKAYQAALNRRPGPVFVELSFDILFNVIDSPEIPSHAVEEPEVPEVRLIKQIFAIIRAAAKPLIVAGMQVYWAEAYEALKQLTEQTAIPVYTNGAGRGTVPMSHLRCFKASRAAALRESNGVLLIGTPLDFRLKYGQKDWNPEGKLIQVENDPAELNHNRKQMWP